MQFDHAATPNYTKTIQNWNNHENIPESPKRTLYTLCSLLLECLSGDSKKNNQIIVVNNQ